jgi:hypothetical protein
LVSRRMTVARKAGALTLPVSLLSPDPVGEGDDSAEAGQPNRKML